MKLLKTLRNLSLLILLVGNTNLLHAKKQIHDTISSCKTTGVVHDRTNIDGCGFIIVLDNGKVIQPVKIIPNIVLYDSMHVALDYYLDSSVVTICQYGIPVVIDCIRDLNPVPQCQASFYYQKVPCDEGEDSLMISSIPCESYQYHFIAETSIINPMVIWNVDGVYADSGLFMNYNFQKPGTHTICMEVRGSNDCNVNTCQLIIIGDTSECEASFTYAPVADIIQFDTLYPNDINLTYKFIGSVTGEGKEWYWSINDSVFSQQKVTDYTFPHYGEYKVCLTVVTFSGCQSSVCQKILVDSTINSCNAYFLIRPLLYGVDNSDTLTPDTGIYKENGYWLENQSYSPTSYVNYFWDFGDGTSSTEFSPTHYFQGGGRFTVCLKMETANCIDTHCETIITDSVAPCKAYFTYCNYNLSNETQNTNDSIYPDTLNKPYIIGFKNLSTPENSSYFWDFGDGSSSFQKNPLHKYNSPGSYNVCLQVFGLNGCWDSYCEWINVGVEECKTDFTIDVLVPDCQGFEIAHMFTPQTNKAVSNYNWSFGDGEYSWEEQPIHIYSNYGTYQVCVDAYTYDGCHARECSFVYMIQDSINYKFKSKCGVLPIRNLVSDESLSLTQIYPMPANDNNDIKLNSDIDQLVTVEILDMLGRKRQLASNYQVSTGENIINLNVGQFMPGTYQILISAKEIVLRSNIVISN